MGLRVLGIEFHPVLADRQGLLIPGEGLLRLARLLADIAQIDVADAHVALRGRIARIGRRQLDRQVGTAGVFLLGGRRVAEHAIDVAHAVIGPDERLVRVALPLGLLQQLLHAFAGVFQQVLPQILRAGTRLQLGLDPLHHVVQRVEGQLEPPPGLIAGRFRVLAGHLGQRLLVLDDDRNHRQGDGRRRKQPDGTDHQGLVPAGPPRGPRGQPFAIGRDRLVRQPVLDVVGKVLGRLVAVRRLQRHGLQADGFQRAGNVHVDRAGRRKLASLHVLQDDFHARGLDRRMAGQQAVERRARGYRRRWQGRADPIGRRPARDSCTAACRWSNPFA